MWSVDYLLLADAVAVAEGKHYIHGAGWDRILAGAFPVTQPVLGIAARLRVPWADTNVPIALELDVLDADGQSILPNPPGPLRGTVNQGRPPYIPPGDDQVIPVAFQIGQVQFPRAGQYVVILRLGGLEAARAPFHVHGPLSGVPEPG